MGSKRLLFIFNPRSGKGQIKYHLLEIVDTFTKAGYVVTIYPTQRPEDALNLVPKVAGEYDLIVCSGGDGTLDEVITGMMHAENRVPVGYIPAGSTNDFAHSLQIPDNMLLAAHVAVNGRKFPCDVGAFNDNHFVYIAAFGLFTDVSYMTDQKLKNIFGHVAYIMEGAKRLVDVPSYHMKIEIDGQAFEDDYVYGMVTNSTSVGGMSGMTGSNVKLDDGEFEVTLIKMPKNAIQLNEIITSLMLPKLHESQYVYSCKARSVKLHSENPVPWTLDGEFGGNHKEVAIRNMFHRITLMV